MNPLRGRRLRLFAIVLLAWGAVVIGRLVQLQLVQGQKYRARAQRAGRGGGRSNLSRLRRPEGEKKLRFNFEPFL